MRKTAFKYAATSDGIPAEALRQFLEPAQQQVKDGELEQRDADAHNAGFTFFWHFKEPVPKHVIVASWSGFGPREPDLVWTGTHWICSEDELSESERELMDLVANQCPGGLGGWS